MARRTDSRVWEPPPERWARKLLPIPLRPRDQQVVALGDPGTAEVRTCRLWSRSGVSEVDRRKRGRIAQVRRPC